MTHTSSNMGPIEGFKVMQWLRQVRDKDYDFYKENPEAYCANLGIDYAEVQRRKARKKLLTTA